MTILDTITAYKQEEVTAKQKVLPVEVLQQSSFYKASCTPFAASVRTGVGIIAEHKRRSPSKQVINDQVSLPEVVQGYEKAGASALSILTDTRFFGGSLDDLALAKAHTSLPLLRKEFIIDPYQVHESKAYGADALLLIAACLSSEALKDLSQLAKELGLDVLVEVHNASELEKCLLPSVDLIGVNNRNLKTFEVSIDTSKELAHRIPSDYVKISESGIQDPQTVRILMDYGYQGFLMGEYFMKHANPGKALSEFIQLLP